MDQKAMGNRHLQCQYQDINYKGKHSNFTVGKQATLPEVDKLLTAFWQDLTSLQWYSSQISNQEEVLDKPKVKDILQDNWSILFKTVKITSDKDWGTRLKGTRETYN